MKKVALLIAFVLTLVSCSKQNQDLARPAASTGTTYFSKVQRFKDNRTPGTDTVWTLRMLNQEMADSFARFDGYVYWESSTVKEVGVLYVK